MVKVVPTEERLEEAPFSQGKETLTGDDGKVAAEQQPTKDEPAEGQPTTPPAAGASAEGEGQRLSSPVSDAAGTGSDVELSPPRSTDPSRTRSKGEEMRHEAPQQSGEPGALAIAEDGSDVLGSKTTKRAAPALDMDKHSGMTTFSLMRHGDDESSLDRPNEGPRTPAEQERDDENATGTLMEGEEENDEEVSEGPPRPARQNTGVGRKFVRQNTGIGDGPLTPGGNKKKKAPFHVPQTMYMGHPVGSPAAEFLERQQHRVGEIKTRREEVAGLLKLVMEHNPNSTGSGLPDIDEVFPDKRGRERSQGDWCV
eukprot:g13301.t1